MELTKEQYAQAQAVIETATRYGVTVTVSVIKQLAGILQYPQPTALTDDRWVQAVRDLFHKYGGGLRYERVQDIAKMLDDYDNFLRTAEPHLAEPSPAPLYGPGNSASFNSIENFLSRFGQFHNCGELMGQVFREMKNGITESPAPVPAPSVDVIKRIKAILAREFPALPILHDRLSKEICSVSRSDLIANPPQEWLDKRDAEWEAAIPQTYIACNPSKTLEQGARFSGIVRTRLMPKPVERVTLESLTESIEKTVHEALQLPLGSKGQNDMFDMVRKLSEQYIGLRSELAKEPASDHA